MLPLCSYCVLSCEAFNSPLYCDASHPQDTFPESDGRSTYNHLIDAVLKNPDARAAYLVKLRHIMDGYLSTGWLQAQVGLIHDAIASSARQDNAKWGAGDIDAGVAALLAQMAARREQLYGKYGYLWPGATSPSPSPPRPLPSGSPATQLRVWLRAHGMASQARIVGAAFAEGPASAAGDASSSSSSSDDDAGDTLSTTTDADVAEAPAAWHPPARAAPAPAQHGSKAPQPPQPLL